MSTKAKTARKRRNSLRRHTAQLLAASTSEAALLKPCTALQRGERCEGSSLCCVLGGKTPAPAATTSSAPASALLQPGPCGDTRVAPVAPAAPSEGRQGYLLPLSSVPLKDRGRNACTFTPYQSVPSEHHAAGLKFLNCGGN